MPFATVATLVEVLGSSGLLDATQLEELAQTLQPRFPDPKDLTAELFQRGWLTRYQLDHLREGRGQELVLGQYVLLERLGEGGMGTVFKARHQRLGRTVALKVIRRENLIHPSSVRRFHREIQATAQLSHPNVVLAFDADEAAGTHFYVMEYVPGINLAQLVDRRGPLPVAAACEYIRQAALGLQHAHERGLVHRDIKPSNLLLTKTDPPLIKLLDLGLARLRLPETESDDRLQSALTQEGVMVGTLDYMAPEQAINAHTVDIRGDLYSLGCTFYSLLTGRVPFPGGTALDKLARHRWEEPPALELSRPDAPAEVREILRRLMAKNPADRYPTPAALAAALKGVLAGWEVCLANPPLAPSASDTAVPSPQRVMGPGGGLALDCVPTLESPSSVVGRGSRRLRPWTVGLLLGSAALLGLLVFLLRTEPRFEEPNPPAPVPVGATPRSRAPAEQPRLINSARMELVRIAPGTFRMGATDTQPDHRPEESPQHQVAITQLFYIGAHEVTQRQFEAVMGFNPARFSPEQGGSLEHPVERVTWYQAVEFCERLSERSAEREAGRSYRLPTEAEWEYAARAGSEGYFCFGDDPSLLGEYGWYKQNARESTHPVGRKKPNAWGLYDVYGNVWDWCSDLYDAQYYSVSPPADPTGPLEGRQRILRGGSWFNNAHLCRVTMRGHYDPGVREANVGFRVVCTVVPARP